RWKRHEGRGVDDARDAVVSRGGDHAREAADVDVVEVLRSAPPDRDERGRMRNRLATRSGANDGVAVADVSGHERARQSAPRGGRAEDDEIVAGGGKRPNDRASQVPGAAGHENSHGISARQYSSTASSVSSSGMAGSHPSSDRIRAGSPTSSGRSFG